MSEEYVNINLSDEELGRRLREAFSEANEGTERSPTGIAFFYVIDKRHEVQYTVRVEEVLI